MSIPFVRHSNHRLPAGQVAHGSGDNRAQVRATLWTRLTVREACSTHQRIALPEAGDGQANVASCHQVLCQLRSNGDLQLQQWRD